MRVAVLGGTRFMGRAIAEELVAGGNDGLVAHRSHSEQPSAGGARPGHPRFGARALERRAGDELAASGARPRRRELSGVESLTPSERRVAQLVADGLGNRQVAESLFVTRKTVEGHLRGVFGKLEITSREQVAAALRGEQ